MHHTEHALKIINHYIFDLILTLSGEFGDVYKGTLTLKDGRSLLVAAKTLKVVHPEDCAP